MEITGGPSVARGDAQALGDHLVHVGPYAPCR